jgi:hypothetical protein
VRRLDVLMVSGGGLAHGGGQGLLSLGGQLKIHGVALPFLVACAMMR